MSHMEVVQKYLALRYVALVVEEVDMETSHCLRENDFFRLEQQDPSAALRVCRSHLDMICLLKH